VVVVDVKVSVATTVSEVVAVLSESTVAVEVTSTDVISYYKILVGIRERFVDSNSLGETKSAKHEFRLQHTVNGIVIAILC